MALILNIETTSTNCSVSLSAGIEIISLKEDNNKNFSHSESLHLFIEDVLNKADKPLSSIDAIAVSEGPGSYTGLRIGVSAAKGLCYSLDVPLISVSTLHALAYQKQVDNGVIVPMLDARRLEVYSAVFSNSYKIIREVRPQILNENSFSEYLENGEVYFVGNANEKAKMVIQH
ncbi:MAG: tRNA (adenosine(37)-N6)-threonylcarbamoyltransferase complex dimerization subunit type 1 TsaB, partial [Flavobacteriaceae bacterium]|nr:tRNA (adenosine(37)-N6)-threonylcarbamoyltransferase complex dimerization subunit type 1 TsaB [Flavobacteriaceae bacterium]